MIFTPRSSLKSKIQLIGVGLIVLLLSWLICFGGISLLVHQNVLLTPIHSIRQLIRSLIFAPVFEEFLFRQGLLAFLHHVLKIRWRYALLLSAFLFAIVHGQLLFLPYFFIGGFVFGLIYIYSKDSYSNIICHCLFNAITLLPALFS